MIEFLIISFSALSVIYTAFLLLVLIGIKNTRKLTKTSPKNNFETVTVIVPFRNEELNIKNSFDSLIKQSYPGKYEIIFIDDNSDDNSVKILSESVKNSGADNVKIHRAEGEKAFQKKKAAVEFGLKNAVGEIIITTDADCTHTENWILKMVSQFDSNTGFVSGPVKFEDESSFFRKMQILEFVGLILTGAGLIGLKYPTICNGANIAYRKKTFFEVDGFSGNDNLSSGDDEFLMQKISKTKNYDVKFCFDEEAVVHTESQSSLSKFFNQRKRWASKSFFYQDKKLITLLLSLFIYFVSLPLQFILGIFVDILFLYSFSLFAGLKIVLEFFVLSMGNNLFKNKTDRVVFIISELVHPSYIMISSVLGLIGNFEWKGRQLKR
ncbi:MAG: glycosyltransferase [Melioribacteraceae bacterium]|nr:glycosyltransferase [Melioribacteraceae bacterium]